MWVNGIIFLITNTREIVFTAVVPCNSRSAKVITHALKRIVSVYESRGLPVTDIFGDNEFDKDELRTELSPAVLTHTPAGAHVGDIEAAVKKAKNRARTIVHASPYKKLPRAMTVVLVRNENIWSNAFPIVNGVSTSLSPA